MSKERILFCLLFLIILAVWTCEFVMIQQNINEVNQNIDKLFIVERIN